VKGERRTSVIRETPQAPEHEKTPAYEKPQIVDHGSLRELTADVRPGDIFDGVFPHSEFS
jgi:hypothetical protein